MDLLSEFIGDTLKFFFLLTPFFVLSVFLSMTQGMQEKQRKILAIKTVFAAFCVCMILFFLGNWIFSLFGITLNSFKIGGGLLLLLTSIQLVNGASELTDNNLTKDISVVPLAIPVTVGPGTTGTLLILGAETTQWNTRLTNCMALIIALIALGGILYSASSLERFLKQRGIVILSKLTGLILAALASQLIFTGIQGFFPALTE